MSAPPRGWTLAAAAVCALALTALDARAGDALDPYRALARSDARSRVLAFTRAAIASTLGAADSDAAPATEDTALDWPGQPCGVYVSLARGRATRACVGTLTPLGGSFAATLRALAWQVVGSDPRHPPVRAEELDSLAVLVAFADTPEPVADPMQVVPSREGLLVRSPRGGIAFLPGEARSIAWALGEARRAGVLDASGDASYQKFAVVVIRQAPPAMEASAHALH